jgi:hypothetical protein
MMQEITIGIQLKVKKEAFIDIISTVCIDLTAHSIWVVLKSEQKAAPYFFCSRYSVCIVMPVFALLLVWRGYFNHLTMTSFFSP